MSEVTIELLQKQLEAEKSNAKILVAQFSSCQQMYNEHSNTILQLRTNENLIKDVVSQQNQDIVNQRKQIEELTAKVNELTPKENSDATSP